MTRFSLSARITALLGIAAIVLLGGAALAMDQLVDSEVHQRMDQDLLAQARTWAATVEIGPDGPQTQATSALHAQPTRVPTVAFWAMRCRRGETLTSHPAPPVVPAQWLNSAGNTPTFADLAQQEHRLRAVWFNFVPDTISPSTPPGQCQLLYMHSRAAMNDILEAVDDILLLIPLTALLLVLLLSPLLVRRGLKPLHGLSTAMRDIGPQAPGQRLATIGTRELEPLVARFNEVLQRMDEGMARERQFAAALAHETRTLLAELRTLVEVEQRYPSHRPMQQILLEVGQIVGELQNTVAGLLLLTRLQAGLEDTTPAPVHLDQVLDRHLQTLSETLLHRHVRVQRHAPATNVTLPANRGLLDMLIGNLLGNAAAYTPAGSVIDIQLQPHSLAIENPAPDLDPREVARFGERFWSKHHGREGHAGLGLALAGAAATAMRIQLQFKLDARQQLQAVLSWSGGAD